jgi:predicted methyltransferase
MHLTRRQALITALAPASLPLRAQEATDAALQAAIAAPHRSATNRARDAARHPLETLRFLGLQPGLTVVELAPGGGWYTEILAPYLREHGRLIAAHYARDSADEGRRRSRASFEAKLGRDPALYDRVQLGTLPSSATFTDPPLAGTADLVLTFRNVHNWLEDGHLDATLAACYAALKPGGALGVEEHRAAPGTPLDRMMKTGYVTEALMEERARAAGFVLAARSEVNANPRDTKDHPNGVWTLPPTLRASEAERARYVAIGESDRYTHRYLKRRA